MRGATLYKKLGLSSGYNQVKGGPNDSYKPTFRTYHGLFEFLIMPFGLANAPTSFHSPMNNSPYLRKHLVFFHGILIYSNYMEAHAEHLSKRCLFEVS